MIYKKCPFCGCEKIEGYYDDPYDGYQGPGTGSYYVQCTACGVKLSGKTQDEADKKWNARPEVKFIIPAQKQKELLNLMHGKPILYADTDSISWKEFPDIKTAIEQLGKVNNIIQETIERLCNEQRN